MTGTQDIVDTIYRLLVRLGDWPTWRQLDYELDRAFDLRDPWAHVRQIPSGQRQPTGDDEPRDDTTVALTVAGLARCPQAAEDVEIFVDSVRLAAEVARQTEPPTAPLIRHEDLAAHLSLPAAGRSDLLARQVKFWQVESLTRVITIGAAGGWLIEPERRTMRRLRDVRDVDDYVARTRAPAEHVDPGSAPVSGPNGTGTGTGDVAPASQLLERIVTREGTAYLMDPHSVIGRGGDGIVYAGTDEAGNPVAVKRVSLRGHSTLRWFRDASYAEREELINRELAGRHIRHVLPVLDTILDQNSFTFITPLAIRSLQDLVDVVAGLRDGTAPQPGAHGEDENEHVLETPTAQQVRSIAAQLTRGLVELHEHGVLHRDIKPSNALLLDHRWVWGDLGIAKLIDAATSTHTHADRWTPAYRAPELYAGSPATMSSDVYALGCTFYALVHGVEPFAGENFREQHTHQLPDLSAVDDPVLAHLMTHMLSKEPGRRPTAQQVQSTLSSQPAGPVLDRLRRVADASNVREDMRAAALAGDRARARAADDALGHLQRIWDQLLMLLQEASPSTHATSGKGAWILTMNDRRLVAQTAEPASSTCEAVQLGWLKVEAEDSNLKSTVANICAIPDSDGVPRWTLLRMHRNAAATDRVKVSRAYSDASGALGMDQLEDHLRQTQDRVPAVSAVRTLQVDLTAQALAELFVTEVEAIDKLTGQAAGRPASS